MNDYILYLVVRDSLKMSSGKIAAQCIHVMDLIYRFHNENYEKLYTETEAIEDNSSVSEKQRRRGKNEPDIIVVGSEYGDPLGHLACNYYLYDTFCFLGTNEEIVKRWPQEVKPSLLNRFKIWQDNLSTVVVLKAEENEWEKCKQIPNCFVMKDAGLTEVEKETETCLGFWPMKRDDAPKLIRRMRLL